MTFKLIKKIDIYRIKNWGSEFSIPPPPLIERLHSKRQILRESKRHDKNIKILKNEEILKLINNLVSRFFDLCKINKTIRKGVINSGVLIKAVELNIAIDVMLKCVKVEQEILELMPPLSFVVGVEDSSPQSWDATPKGAWTMEDYIFAEDFTDLHFILLLIANSLVFMRDVNEKTLLAENITGVINMTEKFQNSLDLFVKFFNKMTSGRGCLGFDWPRNLDNCSDPYPIKVWINDAEDELKYKSTKNDIFTYK